jgi:membrane-associated phospholipid phosphatase
MRCGGVDACRFLSAGGSWRMDGMLSWGTAANIALQSFSPALDMPFKVITFGGEELFFMVFLPLIYWSVDRSTGGRLLVFFLLSAWVNSALKSLAADLRPYQYDNRVKAVQRVSGWGFPSGHTQLSATVWGYLAVTFRRRWLSAVAVVVMVLVPLSRLYLGVHDLPDLVGGYAIGFVLLFAFIKLENRCVSWCKNNHLIALLGIAVSAAATLLAVSPGEAAGCIAAASMLMGYAVGVVLERRYVGFSSDGTILKRVLRYVLGIIVIIGLWEGLTLAFRGFEPLPEFRFVRYALIGLWGSLGAPWVFVSLKLADQSRMSN